MNARGCASGGRVGWGRLVLLLVAVGWVAPGWGAERVLFDFRPGAGGPRVETSDARAGFAVREGVRVLRLETGHAGRWPGVTLMPADGGSWDLSPFAWLVMPVRNGGTQTVTVYCRVDNPGADGRRDCVTGSVAVPAGEERLLRVGLRRMSGSTLEGRLFGMRGYPAVRGGEGTIDPARVNQLLAFVTEPRVDHVFEIGAVRAVEDYVAPTAGVTDADPYFPLIDTFGQYRHRPWPGKMGGMEDLERERRREAEELERQAGPADWSRYGGWTGGPRLQATGFFRVEKQGGKWWLVDPEGWLFFSHGVTCVRMQEFTVVSEREGWFADFPGDRPEFAAFLLERGRVLKGHYAGRTPRCFSFAGANLLRKYGSEWRSRSAEVVHRRLRSWGMNTIGMWSDEATRLMRRTPYVDAIGSEGARRIEGSEGYWGKFPDPFDPGFRAVLERAMAGKRGTSAGDPWCLGYFCDNELAWGDETSLAVAALRSPADQPAKGKFIEALRGRHGDIAVLNRAWGTAHASWEALQEDRTGPDPGRARSDLVAFYDQVAAEYFRGVREVIRAVAPGQLYLGCRFAWVNERAAAAAARHCDVVSFNLYQRGVADFRFNGGADVPLIIGEFHLGALDRGMFHTGLVPTASQAERAAAYRDYVRGALRHPQFVGTHWFQFQDQPTTGRVYDEENYQIGLVDIVDTPYPETVAAVRATGYGMYRDRWGER